MIISWPAFCEPGGQQIVTDKRWNVAIVTSDVLGARMAGPAIRAWNIAIALAVEHNVRLVSLTPPCERVAPNFVVESVDERDLRHIVDWCDVICLQGRVMYDHPLIRESSKIVVIDLYDPLHFETLTQTRGRELVAAAKAVESDTLILNEQFRRGDFFLAASPKQRDMWLGHLGSLGRINVATYGDDPCLDRLIAIAPFGLPDGPPVHSRSVLKGVVPGIAPNDCVILWGGGIYDWYDPLTLLRAIDRLRRQLPRVRLFFPGMRHPNPQVPTMRMAVEARRLSEQLGLTGKYVFFNEDWVPYEERQNYLLEADVAVSTHLDHLKTSFSVRARVLDYLWARLPVVVSTGDFFGDLVAQEELGAVVPPGDVDALQGALQRMLSDAEWMAACSSPAAVVGKRFVWTAALKPLVEFCRDPHRAPDLISVGVSVALPPDSTPSRPSQAFVDNLRILLDHLEEGGARQVASKARSRLQHRFGWHPPARVVKMRERARSHPGLAVRATVRMESTGPRRVADIIDRFIWGGDVAVITPPDANGTSGRIKMHERHGADQIVRAIRREGWHSFECPLPDVFYHCVRATSGLVLDVGANTGFYALLAVSARPDVGVIAFEPFPPAIAMLRENLLLNPRGDSVTVVEKAVSDREGRAALFVPEASHGMVETSCSLNDQFKHQHVAALDVEVITIDRYLERLGQPPISVVKIDVESMEHAVLRGCQRTLQRDRPVVFVEFLERVGNDEAIEELRIEQDLIDVRLQPKQAVVGDAIDFDPNAWNHLLCPAERFSEMITLLNHAQLSVITGDSGPTMTARPVGR
jgi:FkbM family methyltransferase